MEQMDLQAYSHRMLHFEHFHHLPHIGVVFDCRVAELVVVVVVACQHPTQKPRKSKRKDTQVPQLSGPIESVTDEVVYKELDDSLVRVATTASSLEAEQDSGNINKTQSKATPYESSTQGTDSGGYPRCQDTMGDTVAQTRSKRLSKLSNDSLLAKGNTIQSDKDSMKLNELMELCTTLQPMIYMVKRCLLQNKLRMLLKRKVNAAQIQVSTAATTPSISIDEVTLAQAHVELKHTKPKAKAKGIIFHEPEETELVEESSKKAKAKVMKGSSKRVGNKLEQESSKMQKIDDDKEIAKLKQLVKIIPDKEGVAIVAIPLAVKPPSIVDWKIHKEGKKSYYQIIKADGITTASTRGKTVNESYYCQYKEVTAAQDDVSAA
nr:hypothetical protein [Tanacetum cinerariifolium]